MFIVRCILVNGHEVRFMFLGEKMVEVLKVPGSDIKMYGTFLSFRFLKRQWIITLQSSNKKKLSQQGTFSQANVEQKTLP